VGGRGVTAVRLELVQGSDAWLAARNDGIGSSDMPVIAGESPYQSPIELWAVKTGKVPPADIDAPTRKLMDIGKRMEPVLLELYEEETGRRARRAPRMLAHPELPWARASLDAEAPVKRIVEAKWTHARRWSTGDPVPPDVLIQVQWQMFVAGRSVADVVALVGPELRVVEVERDEAMIDDLVFLATDFWRHVQDGVPPSIDGSEATRRTFARMHPVDDGAYLSATPDLVSLVDSFREAKAAVKEAEAHEATLANALRMLIGASSGIDGLVSLKKSKDSERVDWPSVAKDYRALLKGKVDTEQLDFIKGMHTETKQGVRPLLLLSKGTNP
jgi:putative phage-type endonuclease